MTPCLYCGRPLEDDTPMYRVDDDEAWGRLAAEHEPYCAFILTRGWRRPQEQPCQPREPIR